MSDYAMWLLDELLTRYERSAHYRAEREAGEAGRRRVALPLTRETMPDYWDDRSADKRLLIHHALAELEAEGLIAVEWAPHAVGLEARRVILRLEHLPAAYRRAGRIPRAELEERLRETALAWRPRLPHWGVKFVDALTAALASGGSLPAGFAPGEEQLLENLLQAVAALDPAAAVPRRVFSLRVFGASKHFEQQVEGRLVRVLRQFHPAAAGLEDRRELLAEVGLTENPDHIFVSGPLVLAHAGRRADLAAFRPDVGLPASMVAGAEVLELPVDQVLTMENLTTFHVLAARAPDRTLLIYLGGYHNRLRQLFLQRLWQAAPGAAFLHWGDIDLGGFQIFRLLRNGSGVPLQPYRMDLDTYRAHAAGGQRFDGAYGRRLRALLDDPDYELFWPVIAEMLRLERRVEQEAIPV